MRPKPSICSLSTQRFTLKLWMCINNLPLLFFLLPKNLRLLSLVKHSPNFLDLVENLVSIFFLTFFVTRVNVVSCIPAQIPYFRKIQFLRYMPKCSQPIGFLDFTSPEQIGKIAQFLARYTNSWKLTKYFLSGHRQKIVAATQVWLYLKNELMEQTDILHADVNFRKLKVASVVFVCVCVVKNRRRSLLYG